jgi:hypothetical protein
MNATQEASAGLKRARRDFQGIAAAPSEWLLQITSVRWVDALLVALAVSAVVARRTIERKAHPLSRMLASQAKL